MRKVPANVHRRYIRKTQPEYLVVERHVIKRVAWATHEEEEEDTTVEMEPCGMSADLNRRKVVITGKENETGNKRRSVF